MARGAKQLIGGLFGAAVVALFAVAPASAGAAALGAYGVSSRFTCSARTPTSR
jgi:predicted benzoate:H+ symporter BenE